MLNPLSPVANIADMDNPLNIARERIQAEVLRQEANRVCAHNIFKTLGGIQIKCGSYAHHREGGEGTQIGWVGP